VCPCSSSHSLLGRFSHLHCSSSHSLLGRFSHLHCSSSHALLGRFSHLHCSSSHSLLGRSSHLHCSSSHALLGRFSHLHCSGSHSLLGRSSHLHCGSHSLLGRFSHLHSSPKSTYAQYLSVSPCTQAMMRPCYSAIANHAAGGKPAIVFVPTRKHVRLTALDLLTSAAADGNQHRYWAGMASAVCLRGVGGSGLDIPSNWRADTGYGRTSGGEQSGYGDRMVSLLFVVVPFIHPLHPPSSPPPNTHTNTSALLERQ